MAELVKIGDAVLVFTGIDKVKALVTAVHSSWNISVAYVNPQEFILENAQIEHLAYVSHYSQVRNESKQGPYWQIVP